MTEQVLHLLATLLFNEFDFNTETAWSTDKIAHFNFDLGKKSFAKSIPCPGYRSGLNGANLSSETGYVCVRVCFPHAYLHVSLP